MRVGGCEDLVTRDFSSDNLADDISVGEANYESVLGSIVLVLGLSDKSLSGVVIGLYTS